MQENPCLRFTDDSKASSHKLIVHHPNKGTTHASHRTKSISRKNNLERHESQCFLQDYAALPPAQCKAWSVLKASKNFFNVFTWQVPSRPPHNSPNFQKSHFMHWGSTKLHPTMQSSCKQKSFSCKNYLLRHTGFVHMTCYRQILQYLQEIW